MKFIFFTISSEIVNMTGFILILDTEFRRQIGV